jgi:hypothetical protein
MDAAHLERFFGAAAMNEQTDMSRSDSTSSHGSQVWSESSAISSESSADGEYQERHSSSVEDSGLLGGFVSVSVDNTPVPTPRTRSLVKTQYATSPPTSHMQAFHFTSEPQDPEPQQPYDLSHIHPAFRPATADTTIGMALSPPASPPLSPTIASTLSQSSCFTAPPAPPKNTPSHSLTRATESTLTYADLPIARALSRSKSKSKSHGIHTTISSSTASSCASSSSSSSPIEEIEKKKKQQQQQGPVAKQSRMSILRKFYAF